MNENVKLGYEAALANRTPSARVRPTNRAGWRKVGVRGSFVKGAPYRRVRSLRSLGLMPGQAASVESE